MSLAVLHSRALSGMDAPAVTVEVHLANGLPSFTLVGLPDTEVKEARDRVRAAIQNAQFEFPARRITVNLAPADLPKESGRFDLPIALGILAASGQIDLAALRDVECVGELSLSGELRPIRGALAMAVHATQAQRALLLPIDNAAEAALDSRATIYPARSLLAVCAHLSGREPLVQQPHTPITHTAAALPDLQDVKGQHATKRALEIAAAGQHSLLMVGPPGTGKSMLAARLPSLMPVLDESRALEVAALHSIAGRFKPEHWQQRPYRAPHHTASAAALVGGGADPRPGEISLAHHGVLFLDELPEFDRRVLESLREPLETGHISLARAARRVDYPARFQLVAAMNPCPCGYYGHPDGRCRCTPDQISRYRGKLSGPLLDRIDMTVEVAALPVSDLQQATAGESSATVRQRVDAALAVQMQRQQKPNALLDPKEVDAHCTPDDAGQQLLAQAMQRLQLSARAYHRILRVARTIADLQNSAQVSSAHIAEAVQLRRHAIT